MGSDDDRPTLIRGGTLIDGTDREPQRGMAVLVEDGRIRKVAPERDLAAGNGWRVLDADGHTILPGLIEAHMHFLGSREPNSMMWVIEPPYLNCARAVFDAWKVLDYGFTTVRDVGSRNGVAIKQAVAEGAIVGPRVVPAHYGLSMTCGHGDVHPLPSEWLCGCSALAHIVDGVDAVRHAVRKSVREGADLIKVWLTGGTMTERDSLEDQHYSDEEIATIVAEAHRLRRKVAAHSEGILGTHAAIRGGVDSIEHGFELDEAACHAMKEKGIFLVATLSLLHGVVNTPGVPEYAKTKAKPMFDTHIASFRRAVEMGVRIGSGCDAFSDPVTPFGPYNIKELALMVEAGLTPLQAIRAATASNAELLGLAGEIGTIEAGKRADVLVVRGELADDIGPLMDKENIATLLKGGRDMPRLKDVWPEAIAAET